jgi:predicted peroxiredoxin
MSSLLIQITHGPEAPTRAALGFLVARSAAEAGHDVSLFLAGDAVQLLREPVLDSLVGLGTGSLRESYDAIVEQGGTFYVSGMSSKARGFEPDGQAEPAMPDRLVELVLAADRVLTY